MTDTDPPSTIPDSQWGQLHAIALGTHSDLAAWVAARALDYDAPTREALLEAVALGTLAIGALRDLVHLAERGATAAQVKEAHRRVEDLREAATSLMQRHQKE